MTLYDIVTDVFPKIRKRVAGEAISAGDALYISGDEQVKKTANASCSGKAFAGIAMDSVASGDYLGVATAPTEVYANASGSIAAGSYIVPDSAGKVQAAAGGLTDPVIIGYAVKAASGGVVLMKLIDAPNISSV